MNTTAAATPPIASRRLVRWLLVAAGVLCVGLGAAGVVVPGLPTTVFLIVATWCFARSCPWLEQKLVRNRFFAPFLVYLDRTQPMPARAKVAAIGAMWLFVSLAIMTVASRDTGGAWAAAALAGAAMIGTVVVALWDAPHRRRGDRAQRD